MTVRLAVVDRPAPKTRSHILFVGEGPFLNGTAVDVPQYCCGGCGHCLVQGVHAKQFVDKSRPVDSVGAEIKGLDLAIGDYLISATLQVPTENLTLFTELGPLLISCPKCQATNQMVSPNQLF